MRTGFALLAIVLAPVAAHAAGWESVHKHVKPSGQCAGQEVLASWYNLPGRRTANGEMFDANGNTAAARTWSLGTVLTVTNPKNGRSLSVRINDRGPYGVAWRKGARLDLARGAARRLGMSASQYVCVGGARAEATASSFSARRARPARQRRAEHTPPADRSMSHMY